MEESFAFSSLTFIFLGLWGHISQTHSSFPHTHTHTDKTLAHQTALVRAMMCGRCQGVSIYFIKASYYTPMACGEQYTVVYSPQAAGE